MVISIITGILIGTTLGFASGIGLGGGSLLVLWLNFKENLEQNTIRTINLLFFLSSASIRCVINAKQGNIPWKKILPGILGGSVSAAIISLFFGVFSSEALKTLFGILLIAAGFQQLLYRPKR